MPWHKDLKPAQFVLIKVFKVLSRAIGTHLTSLINYLDLCGCLNFVSYCSEELHNCKFPCIFLALFGNKRYHFFSVIPLTARCTRYIYGRGDCINLKTLGCARMHSRKWASAYILCSLKENKNFWLFHHPTPFKEIGLSSLAWYSKWYMPARRSLPPRVAIRWRSYAFQCVRWPSQMGGRSPTHLLLLPNKE